MRWGWLLGMAVAGLAVFVFLAVAPRHRRPKEPGWRAAIASDKIVPLAHPPKPVRSIAVVRGKTDEEVQYRVPPPPKVVVWPDALAKSPDGSAVDAAKLIERCQEAISRWTSYQATLVVSDRDLERRPRSQKLSWTAHRPSGRTRVEWLDGPSRGRIAALDARRPEGRIWVKLGHDEAKDRADKEQILHLPPDHPLLRATLSTPLGRLGIESWIALLSRAARAANENDARFGTLFLLPEAPIPGRGGLLGLPLEQRAGAGATRAQLAQGQRRAFFIDSKLGVPVWMQISDPNGAAIETDSFEDLRVDPTLSAEQLELR